jgi:hypothetical protein
MMADPRDVIVDCSLATSVIVIVIVMSATVTMLTYGPHRLIGAGKLFADMSEQVFWLPKRLTDGWQGSETSGK